MAMETTILLTALLGESKIAWFANNGNGDFGARAEIGVEINQVRWVGAADLDGDGDEDVVASAGNVNFQSLVWFANSGAGTFGPQQEIGGGAGRRILDLDGDGDLDIVTNGGGWYKNGGAANFGDQLSIANNLAVFDIDFADFDGDGDLDVVSVGANKLVVVPSEGGGNFGAQQAVDQGFQGAGAVSAADLDGGRRYRHRTGCWGGRAWGGSDSMVSQLRRRCLRGAFGIGGRDALS